MQTPHSLTKVAQVRVENQEGALGGGGRGEGGGSGEGGNGGAEGNKELCLTNHGTNHRVTYLEPACFHEGNL
jgi:hypothetical protein